MKGICEYCESHLDYSPDCSLCAECLEDEILRIFSCDHTWEFMEGDLTKSVFKCLRCGALKYEIEQDD